MDSLTHLQSFLCSVLPAVNTVKNFSVRAMTKRLRYDLARQQPKIILSYKIRDVNDKSNNRAKFCTKISLYRLLNIDI